MAMQLHDHADTVRRMERMYRPQRRLYDATRKYYLLGRDRLIRELGAAPGETVLEIGSGTGRNLVLLARAWPGTRLFGLEPAPAMLETASRALLRHGLDQRVRLVHGIAQTLDPARDLSLSQGLDHIVISYALSMIPRPQEVVRHALFCLRPGGTLHIVDFGQMQGLPAPAAWALRKWLARFEVTPSDAPGSLLSILAAQGQGRLGRSEIGGGYATLLRYERR